ncbi:hypothetical protein KA005_65200, partial [bacterium]|nr:hypothetical protein [bacterium]
MTYVNPWADGIKPNGADIDNIKTDVEGIQTDLSNTTDGLGALKTDIGNVSGPSVGGSGVDGVKTVASSENISPNMFYEYLTLTIDAGQTLGLSASGRMLLR